MKFYTLLHVAENERSTHNNRVKNFSKQISVYLKCIQLLQHTLRDENISLDVITNNREYLYQLMAEPFINIIELDFSLDIPSGTNFFSAHYKLEVFKYLSTLNEPYTGLIDNDIICINRIPTCFRNCIEKKIPLYYDISNQVLPVYGQDIILAEKQTISSTNQVGIWAGGEFITGSPLFFKQLYSEIETLKDIYFKNIKSFHHQGDEFLTSVAIENCLLKLSTPIIDAGKLNIISRYWGYPPKHKQLDLDEYLKCFLIHLPANKKFLSKVDIKKMSRKNLIAALKRDLYINRPKNILKFYLERLIK